MVTGNRPWSGAARAGLRLPVPRPGRPSAVRPGDGFALPAVLWILVLVGAVTATFLAAAQDERRAVANAVESTRARWAARAGLARAAAALDVRLADPAAPRRFRSAGDSLLPPLRMETNGLPVRVELLDSRARLHLNLVGAPRLRRLLGALGVDAARSERIAAAVLDWRDPDERPRRDGAEAPAYAAAGLSARPRNAPFASVEELRGVRGVFPRLYRRLAPLVTVVGDGRINVNGASAPVLATLPVVDLRGARALVRARTAGRTFSGAFDVARALPTEQGRLLRDRMEAFEEAAAFGPRRAELSVRAVPPAGGAGATLRGVVELEGGRSWRLVRIRER